MRLLPMGHCWQLAHCYSINFNVFSIDSSNFWNIALKLTLDISSTYSKVVTRRLLSFKELFLVIFGSTHSCGNLISSIVDNFCLNSHIIVHGRFFTSQSKFIQLTVRCNLMLYLKVT